MAISLPGNLKSYNKLKLFILGGLILSVTWLLYEAGLLNLWIEDEEYGHGLMVAGLLGYILFQNRNKLAINIDSANWHGILICFCALTIYVVGDIASIAQVKMYSIWIFAIGIVFSFGGWKLFKQLLIPLLIIFLLIPLPGILGPFLTQELQLISSKIGVWVIRLFGGIVYLQGNIIDMGDVKLLVAEACAGLRYLFPLMSIGAIAAYLMKAPYWMRWLIFIATIPVTVFMNSFRIGVTGLLTEAYGSGHTEGFLHFFEGWVVFVASLLILVIITWLLTRIMEGTPSLNNVFSIYNILPGREESKTEINWQKKPAILFSVVSIGLAVLISSALFERKAAFVESKPLSLFPSKIGEWKANESRLPPTIEAVAGASDYYYGDYTSVLNKKVNVYIAFYKDQKNGAAPHSPKVCIPGDGWKITSDTEVKIVDVRGIKYKVSRLLIKKGKHQIVTYYWLKQGKHIFSQQFFARLNLLWFAITENRSDAALIRLVSEVNEGEDIVSVDKRLQEMSTGLLSVLNEYVPD